MSLHRVTVLWTETSHHEAEVVVSDEMMDRLNLDDLGEIDTFLEESGAYDNGRETDSGLQGFFSLLYNEEEEA